MEVEVNQKDSTIAMVVRVVRAVLEVVMKVQVAADHSLVLVVRVTDMVVHPTVSSWPRSARWNDGVAGLTTEGPRGENRPDPRVDPRDPRSQRMPPVGMGGLGGKYM